MSTFATMFSGGGGADVGLMAAGLSPVWAVEYDPAIAQVYRRNIGEHVIVSDVRSVDYAALPRVDWLHASPVCTNASVANPNGKESETDIETAQAVVRAIRAQTPQVFTLENVWGYRDYAAFRLILNALGDEGYFYDFEHVNAADFGVPQTRRRLILRASRGLLPALPQPVTWMGWYAAIEDLIPTLPESQLAPWQLSRLPEELRTLLISNAKTEYGDGMADANEPAWSVTSNTAGRSRAVLVEMQNTRAATARDGSEPAPTISHSMASRPSHMQAVFVKGDDYSGEDGIVTCIAALPAPTIRSGRSTAHRAVLLANGQYDGRLVAAREGDPAHTITGNTNQTRLRAMLGARVVAMSPRCLARFQSVPDWYQLPDKRTLAAKVIGNMVPPLLMQRIAEQMAGAE